MCSTYGTPLTSECPISDASPSAQQQQQQKQTHASTTGAVATAPCTASPAAAYGAGPSTSPFAATAAMPVTADAPADAAAVGAAGLGAPSTPVPVRACAPGELATPRLASALAHVADDVAEARVDGSSEPGFATPAVTARGGVEAWAGASVHKGPRTDAAGGGAEATTGAAGSRLDKEAGGVDAAEAAAKVEEDGTGAPASDKGEGVGADGLSFYAFPTLEQLEAATEEELRAAGFG